MKKLASIIAFVFVVTLTAQAQKKDRKERKANFTVEQQTTLAVKKMTLALDLSNSQQRKMKPLIANQMADKKAMRTKMKAMKESGKKPTDDEKFAWVNTKLDKQIAFKNSVKEILNDEQFEKFEKAQMRRNKMAKNTMKKRKNRKGKKRK